MLDRIGGLFRARTGDGVRVTQGPYAGQTGTLLDESADGRFTVYIDDCCQPVLDRRAFRRIRRGRQDVATAIDATVNADEEALIARAGSHGRSGGRI